MNYLKTACIIVIYVKLNAKAVVLDSREHGSFFNKINNWCVDGKGDLRYYYRKIN